MPGGLYAGTGTRGWKTKPGALWQYIDRTASPLSGITELKAPDKSKSKSTPGRVKLA